MSSSSLCLCRHFLLPPCRTLLQAIFHDGHGLGLVVTNDLREAEAEADELRWLLRDVVAHGSLVLMAMGARQESQLWLEAGFEAGLSGMSLSLLECARWWLRTYPDVSPAEVRPFLEVGWHEAAVRKFYQSLLKSLSDEVRGRGSGGLLRDGRQRLQSSLYTGQPRLSLLPGLVPRGGRDDLQGAIGSI